MMNGGEVMTLKESIHVYDQNEKTAQVTVAVCEALHGLSRQDVLTVIGTVQMLADTVSVFPSSGQELTE